MHDFLFILGCLGILLILKYGFIFEVPREWLKGKSKVLQEFLGCCQCMGFWTGFIFFLLKYLLEHGQASLEAFFFAFMMGGVISFLGMYADSFIVFMDEITYKIKAFNEKEEKRNGRKDP